MAVVQLCLYFLANVNLVLPTDAERLSQSCAAHFELIVFFIARESRLDVTAQVGAVFNPHAVLVVYLHDNAVVRADVDVNKEILFAFKPFLNGLLHCTFTDHVFKC